MTHPSSPPAPMTAERLEEVREQYRSGRWGDGLPRELFGHIDALTARVAHWQSVHQTAAEANERLRAELAAARKVEDGEVADRVRELIGWELPEDASDDLVRRHFIDNKSANLLTRLSAALKEAERRETEAKTLQHQLASDLTVAVARARAAEDSTE